ncbi:GHMP kinase ATP-binding conserved site [Lasiodiplodia theobromae]|uniref:GHMP kinase ATP-binding conserved site n=1 Tax=Lasiodiplodia theobromae TaxID=45133 RepID=UPI0015C2CE5D|nr:GHMP kinase ATP-binding conserved site [Lasiodiplodia theobromae]KAF4544438.1 GHMP kinase ATP-binding conserved site [Lasiodiplodia theobromae]
MSAIHATTESAYQLVSGKDFNPKSSAVLQQHLGDLIAINHGLLVSLGVSHPKIERTCALVDGLDVGWTKITGAGGGGGCAIVMLKPQIGTARKNQSVVSAGVADELGPAEPNSSAQKLLDLERMLADEGIEMVETKLAGDGVGVLWPAVLCNASGAEGDFEVDQESFLRLEGKEAIEDLVGINVVIPDSPGTAGQRNGWRFWRR